MKAALGSLMGLVLCVSAAAEPLLEGRVRLDSGAPVPGAQVLLFDLVDLRASPLAATTDGSGHFTLPVASLAGVLPQQFELGANYPNPFNPSTMIPYQLPASMYVRLEVFNLLGQRVATLVDGEQPAGLHTASWDATDAGGEAVGAGVYLYRLSGDGVQATRRMLLIDGQAGIPSGGSGTTGLEGGTGAGTDGDGAPVYGLTVSAPGRVPYVDPDFRVEAGAAPLDLVVETPGSVPSSKAASSGGILGDVDNTGGVDFFDALLVALYSQDSSIVMPNQGDISLGDVNADGRVDLSDAWVIAAWLNDPSDPSLPAGIGQPAGAALASLSPDPSTVTFADDGAWHRFTVQAGEPVEVVVNPGAESPRLEITTRSGRSNFCPAEADDDVSRQDGQTLYLAGCATGPATVELRRSSDGTVLRTYTFEVTGLPADLVVESVSVSDSMLTPGQSFVLSATVRNQGTAGADPTTLRWYRSTNRTISTRDTEAGTDAVGALAAQGTAAESIGLTAPSTEGTWYYGACVESLPSERGGNNCSAGVGVTVEASSPDLIVESASVSDSTLTPGQSFTLSATVRNQGTGQSAVTTLRWYRSTNATISTRDTQVGTDVVGALAAPGTSAESIGLTAPSNEGTWYYGACVESLAGEVDTRNNCSPAVRVIVAPAPAPRTWKVYWTDSGTDRIQRSNLDGSGVEDLVTTGLALPVGVALDVSGGKMYWADVGTAKLQRSNLDGSGIEDLVTSGLDAPVGVALDVSGGKLYWTDSGTERVQRSNLDGSGVEDLVTTGLAFPVGVALDVSGGKMYWADVGTGKVQRSNLDGSGVEDLVTGLTPIRLALDVSGGKLYWTDSGTDKIQRSNLDGSGVEDLVTTGLDTPDGIALGLVPVEASGLAPADQDAFNSRMVGKSLRTGTWYLDFVAAGRFSEDGRLPGSYSYSSTGPNTGLLEQIYDGGNYGGACETRLTFGSETSGTYRYTCDNGAESQGAWRVAEIGAPYPPQVVPRSGTDTVVEVRFPSFFQAGETRAFDFQGRMKTGSWRDTCHEYTDRTGRAQVRIVSQGFINLAPGTVYEFRYRYRNSSRCGEGTPDPWSEIGEGATSGGGTSQPEEPVEAPRWLGAEAGR